MFDTGIDETVKLVRAAGGTCYGYVCNLCNREDVYKKAEIMKQEVGQVYKKYNGNFFFSFIKKKNSWIKRNINDLRLQQGRSLVWKYFKFCLSIDINILYSLRWAIVFIRHRLALMSDERNDIYYITKVHNVAPYNFAIRPTMFLRLRLISQRHLMCILIYAFIDNWVINKLLYK